VEQKLTSTIFLGHQCEFFQGIGQRSAVSSPPRFGARHGASIHPPQSCRSTFVIRISLSLNIRSIRAIRGCLLFTR